MAMKPIPIVMMDQVVPARGSIMLVPIGQYPLRVFTVLNQRQEGGETFRGTQDRTLIPLVLGLLVIRRRKDNVPLKPHTAL